MLAGWFLHCSIAVSNDAAVSCEHVVCIVCCSAYCVVKVCEEAVFCIIIIID